MVCTVVAYNGVMMINFMVVVMSGVSPGWSSHRYRTMDGSIGHAKKTGRWLLRIFILVALTIWRANSAAHTEVADFAHTHLVDENVFELHVPVDILGNFVKVPQTSDDLSEHHSGIVLG
jgi:hypothetical protein